MNALNNFLFVALPYLALAVFLIGTIYRYRFTKFKITSLSSEFLETRGLFWGSVPFHYGLLILFVGHLIGFLFPGNVLAWNNQPVRLLILEISAFAFGISAFVGLIGLFLRRTTNPRVKVVTSGMDLVIEILLIIQIFLGLWVAISYRWGSSWFASVMAPYLKSIFYLNPDITLVTSMPVVIKLHIALAFVIILLVPFTRLVHFLVPPVSYLWRPFQKVIWRWDRKSIRSSRSPWVYNKSKNN